MKTQKLQFALTSLHNLQDKNRHNNNNNNNNIIIIIIIIIVIKTVQQ